MNDYKKNEELVDKIRLGTEDLYNEIMECARDAIFFLSSEGIVVTLSRAFETITGWKKEVWIGKSFIGLVHPEEIQLANQRLIHILKGNTSPALELRILKKSGEYVSSEILSSPLMKDGRIVGMLGIARDITEQKLVTEALRKSEENFHVLFDENPLPTVLSEIPSGKITFANKSMAAILGMDNKDIIGKTANDLGLLKNTADLEKLTRMIISQGYIDKFEIEKDLPGDLRGTDLVFMRLVNINEKQYCLTVVQDISNQKLIEDKLRSSEEKYRLISSLTSDYIFRLIVAANGKVRMDMISDNFQALTGRKPEDINTPEQWAKVIHPDDIEKLLAKLNLLVSEGGDEDFECRSRTTDGKLRWVQVMAHAVKLSKKEKTTIVVGAVKDVTIRKQAEEALKKAKDDAEQSDRLKSAFLANMSHEIRTPMNGIMGFAGLLRNQHLTGEEQLEYIGIIEKSGARMLNILNDLIDISKIESGQMNVSISMCNINEHTEFIYNFFRPDVESKGMRFLLSNSLSSTEATIRTDKEKVDAVLTNLIKNAIKFTRVGTIEFGYKRKGDWLEFFVKDTGVGISPEQKEIIFERFRQGSESLARNYEGAGLGLSISKSFVEMLGGSIWVESNSDKSQDRTGSTFYFTIPYISELVVKSFSESIFSMKEEESEFKKIKVLIAEDDEASFILMSKVIGIISNDILRVKNGVKAVEACRINTEIDLVMMDIKMPEMDGYEATRQIRQFNKKSVIIAQTAYAQTGDKEKALNAGCDDYISKPIKKDELLAVIKKYFSD